MSGAKVGDKTMMDALIPASEAVASYAGADEAGLFAAAAQAAGRDPDEITLCAATKVQTDDTIRAAIAAGITVCGENRVQELTAHLDDYAYDGARVHFIGHLQTNKVRFVVGRVDLIESVDSPRAAQGCMGGRGPNRAVPTRTRVAPSRTASS